MTAEAIAKYKATLKKYIPLDTVDFVFNYLSSNGIYFVITKERASKLGDYRWPQHRYKYHQITVNGNLNIYSFLFVLLHEMAHHAVYLKHKNTVNPHGIEWQQEYRNMLVLHKGTFPKDIETVIAKYCSTLPLKNKIENEILDMMKIYDDASKYLSTLQVKDLPINAVFKIDDGRAFRVIEKLRTRYKCEHLETKVQYLVHGTLRVTPINN